ncbi:MAG: 3-keto-disaccharide hydrolase [Isosphaeraceae bacterium]
MTESACGKLRGCVVLLMILCPLVASAQDAEWTDLTDDHELANWRQPTGNWFVAGDARIDPHNARRLVGVAGKGVIINGPEGRTRNLYTSRGYGDLEMHLEFLIPKGSNSGVKLQGLYEIQICDSRGARKLTGSECGGIYPRAELLPRYHHLDDGYAPKVNAAGSPGEWQSLELVFRAPRFDASGKKTANARFVKVVLNGKVVHENQELEAPTGHAWRLPEARRGPLMLQADHGPVAFRNIRVRALD